MLYSRKHLFCIFLCILSFKDFAQTHHFENYSSAQGLLSDEVYSMHQDQKGYLWLFTNFGVQKYNGSQFRKVLNNLPLNESFIYSAFETKSGRMWVANSNARIYEIKNDSAFMVQGLESVSALFKKTVAEIYQLHVDDSLNIYLVTKRYSYKLKYTNAGYKAIDLKTIDNDSVVAQIIEKNGIPIYVLNLLTNDLPGFWLKNNHLLLQIITSQKDSLYKIKRSNFVEPGHFKKFQNSLYFSYFDKIVKIDSRNHITYLTMPAKIQNYNMDKRGHLWVGCFNEGLYEFDTKDSLVGHYLDNLTVNDILIDSNEGLWASTSGEGLFYCANLNIIKFKQSDILGKPLAFMKPINNKLAIGNTKGDIFLIENKNIEILIKNDIASIPMDIVQLPHSFMISYLMGLKKLSEQPKKLTDILNSNGYPFNFKKLYVLSPDTLIAIQMKSLVFFVKEKLNREIRLNHKIFDCYRLKHSVFLATNNGLFLLQSDSAIKSAALSLTNDIEIRLLRPDQHGKLWCCSHGYGLFIVENENTITHLTTSDGLPSDIIYGLCFTNDKKVLLATNKGLYVSDYSGVLSSLAWKNIYHESVHDVVMYDQKIFLKSKNSLVILNPDANEHQYYFNFARVLVNNKEINSSQLLSLNHNENNIEFDFDLISYAKTPDMIMYHLKGPINDEGKTTIHELKFQNLSPGNYQLTVIPHIKNGSHLQIIIPFVINTAFYQTTFFKLLSFLISLAIVIVAVSHFFKTRKKREDLKNEAQRLILEYKLIALKAQINPHFMSNCLASIQNLIMNNKILLATGYISKFGLLVRQILDFSSRSLITISKELEIATLYLELEQMRFQHKFIFKIEIDEQVDPGSCFVPSLILNPIIENAIWHGISSLDDTEEGELIIKVYREEKKIVMAVIDNGRGITKKPFTIGNIRESKGIGLIEQRLRNINFLYNIKSAQLIYDYRHKKGDHQTGTTALISLPDNLKPLHDE